MGERRDKNTKFHDLTMSAKETIGAILVVAMAFLVFIGIQLLSSTDNIGGTSIPLSIAGILIIIVCIAIVVWYIKEKL